MRYLIDTDWAIHYLNDRRDIVQRLRALQDDGLTLSLISLAELYEGVFYSRDPEGDERDLQDFLRGVTVLGSMIAFVGSLEENEGDSVPPAR